MAVTHSTAARNAATDAVTALIGASGNMKLRISPSSVGSPGTAAATLPLTADAFADSITGTATANAITSDTNATGNASAVAYGTLETSAGVIVIHFGVAASGSDADMSGGLTVGAGDTVSCSSLTYKAIAA